MVECVVFSSKFICHGQAVPGPAPLESLLRVATLLENLEKSGNWKVVREKSGKMNYYNYSVAAIITLWISYTFLYKPILSRWSILDNVVVRYVSIYECGSEKWVHWFLSLLLRGSIISKCPLKMSGKVRENRGIWSWLESRNPAYCLDGLRGGTMWPLTGLGRDSEGVKEREGRECSHKNETECRLCYHVIIVLY